MTANAILFARIKQQLRRAAEAEGKRVTLCPRCRMLMINPPAACPACQTPLTDD